MYCQHSAAVGYGDPSNTTIFEYTISDVYLFEQHVSTLLLGHLQAIVYLTFSHLTTYIYICRTAPLTSRRCILNIYSTNIRTEYFKYAA
jgi:hypothetical protein